MSKACETWQKNLLGKDKAWEDSTKLMNQGQRVILFQQEMSKKFCIDTPETNSLF